MDVGAARPDLPPAIARVVGSRRVERVTLGRSSAAVFRLRGRTTLYLKSRAPGPGRSLREERDRLLWIGGRLPVPEVAAWAEDRGREFLLTTEVPGVPASEPRSSDDARRLAWSVGASLRAVHSLPVEGCPHDAGVAALLTEAARNLERGLVDAADFEPERRGRRPEDLLLEAERTRPGPPAAVVFTHGDACLPNFVVAEGAPAGLVDWSLAGAGDPVRDLALALRSFAWNHGPAHAADLLAAYGLDSIDDTRAAWYLLLDELF